MYPWQAAALECGERGGHLVYGAPTSGGKSLVAEVLMLRRLLGTARSGPNDSDAPVKTSQDHQPCVPSASTSCTAVLPAFAGASTAAEPVLMVEASPRVACLDQQKGSVIMAQQDEDRSPLCSIACNPCCQAEGRSQPHVVIGIELP